MRRRDEYVVSGAIGDLDGDGRPDLVTVSAAKTLNVHHGLQSAVEFSAVLTLAPERVAIADLDGDDVLDLFLDLFAGELGRFIDEQADHLGIMVVGFPELEGEVVITTR